MGGGLRPDGPLLPAPQVAHPNSPHPPGSVLQNWSSSTLHKVNSRPQFIFSQLIFLYTTLVSQLFFIHTTLNIQVIVRWCATSSPTPSTRSSNRSAARSHHNKQHHVLPQVVVDLSEGEGNAFAYLSDFTSGRLLTFRYQRFQTGSA